MKNLIYLLTILLTISCQSGEIKTQPIENHPIEGVWKVTQIITQTPGNHFANPNPQAGVFIFTKNYYSITWNPNDAKQEDYKNKWRPTDEEKIASYNSIISNSGKYEIKEGKLITNPVVSKTPSFIGGKAVYDFLVNEKTLTLTLKEVISYDGVYDKEIKNYKITIKLKRVE
ncbi:MAG: hypothetical protein HND52_11155 [Ignavibacteriae bacterium]|nr:hypothetical protein [Ignavibacteriota bacterium]NOG98505.1 hypothetical protein [Ignavibacteriota bacterium]